MIYMSIKRYKFKFNGLKSLLMKWPCKETNATNTTNNLFCKTSKTLHSYTLIRQATNVLRTEISGKL